MSLQKVSLATLLLSIPVFVDDTSQIWIDWKGEWFVQPTFGQSPASFLAVD
jgi:hypothetical protein